MFNWCEIDLGLTCQADASYLLPHLVKYDLDVADILPCAHKKQKGCRYQRTILS